jgi:hypothetical protein
MRISHAIYIAHLAMGFAAALDNRCLVSSTIEVSMRERIPTTVSYRLLARPELGTGLGNTVLVGLDVENADQMAPLIFEGLPNRIDEMRRALKSVRTFTGHLFGASTASTARELRSVMGSSRMKLFAPELIAGAEMFARAIPDADYR